MPELGQRGVEAVFRGALGEPHLSAHFINTDAYLDAAVAITTRILCERRSERAFVDAIVRDVVALYDELSSSTPTHGTYGFRTMPMWTDEPRWAIHGEQPRTVAGAWLKAV
jgi:hypothetical protein